MLPSPGPFWGGNMSNKVECQKHHVKRDLNVTTRKQSKIVKNRQKYSWNFTANFVSFENDSDRKRSYELWIESFFHLVN